METSVGFAVRPCKCNLVCLCLRALWVLITAIRVQYCLKHIHSQSCFPSVHNFCLPYYNRPSSLNNRHMTFSVVDDSKDKRRCEKQCWRDLQGNKPEPKTSANAGPCKWPPQEQAWRSDQQGSSPKPKTLQEKDWTRDIRRNRYNSNFTGAGILEQMLREQAQARDFGGNRPELMTSVGTDTRKQLLREQTSARDLRENRLIQWPP